jgi:biotin-(acetyl-CoA carboxylase) ligase
VLESFFEWRNRLGSVEFIQASEESLAFIGDPVPLKNSGGQSFSGILQGINAQGNLRLRLADGMEKLVSVGDVHLRPDGG